MIGGSPSHGEFLSGINPRCIAIGSDGQGFDATKDGELCERTGATACPDRANVLLIQSNTGLDTLADDQAHFGFIKGREHDDGASCATGDCLAFFVSQPVSTVSAQKNVRVLT